MNCQDCGEVATYNIQKMWVANEIIDGGDDYKLIGFPDDQDPTDDDNLFLCKECYLNQFDKNIRRLTLPRKYRWESVEVAN